jgi:hypothetical protein
MRSLERSSITGRRNELARAIADALIKRIP